MYVNWICLTFGPFISRFGDGAVDGIRGLVSREVDEAGVGAGLPQEVDRPPQLRQLRVLLLRRQGQSVQPRGHVCQALLEGRHHLRKERL